MGVTKFVVQAQLPECPLSEFTADRTDSHVLASRGQNGERGDSLVLALMGTPDIQDAFLETARDAFDRAELVRRDDETAVVEAEGPSTPTITHIFPLVTEVTGAGTLFQPTFLARGWATLTFHALTDGPAARIVNRCKDRLEKAGCEFRLVRFRAFDPEEVTAIEQDLTEKQLEVVRVAYSMGYYETPRDCTLANLADVFGISKAAVHMRLRTAERKIISKYI